VACILFARSRRTSSLSRLSLNLSLTQNAMMRTVAVLILAALAAPSSAFSFTHSTFSLSSTLSRNRAPTARGVGLLTGGVAFGGTPSAGASSRAGRAARMARMVGMSPEEAMSTAIPEIGVRADELIPWLWNVAQYRTDYPECSLKFFADDAVYEDLIYKDPFVGKPAVEAFLRKCKDLAPPDFVFVLDKYSDGAKACGFTWHVELQTRPEAGQFANGASFYELNDEGKICYVRDVVEPPLKTGDLLLRFANFAAKLLN